MSATRYAHQVGDAVTYRGSKAKYHGMHGTVEDLVSQGPHHLMVVRFPDGRGVMCNLSSATPWHGVPGCSQCEAAYAGGPQHNPSRMCKSGSRPHCTCDACF